MTGKSYYITTLADWQRYAVRFAHSHYIVLGAPGQDGVVGAQHAVPGEDAWRDADDRSRLMGREDVVGAGLKPAPTGDAAADASAAGDAYTKILVLIEADEGVHLALEDDPSFEALPHPLAQRSISTAAQSALAPHGVAPGATTFDAAESLAHLHPLLKHRVF